MAKLKFNLLELTSKRIFLDKLMPTGTLSTPSNLMLTGEMTLSLYDEWTNCQTRWTPGDLKDLERKVEGRKAELKAVKEAVIGFKEEISNFTGHLVNLKDSVSQELQTGSEKLVQIAAIETDISLMQTRLTEFADRIRPLTQGLVRCDSCEDSGSVVGAVLGIRSGEELRAELDELDISVEKKKSTLQAHQTNISELDRLLRHHTEDLTRLQAEEARLLEVIHLKQRQKDENAEASLEELCVWYRSAIETVADLTRMKFEMIRPDYILVTFKTSTATPDGVSSSSSLPVHLNVDPQTGRLLDAQIGATLASHNLAWREICDRAVENNDICTLLHAIQQRI